MPLFPSEGSAEDFTRWASVVSLVERNSFEISWTKEMIPTKKFADVSKLENGTVYPNKPPGIAFLSAPFYAIVKVILGKPTSENVRTSWFILRFIISTLPLVLLAVWLIGMEVDTFSAAILLFATPLFPFSLLYSSHILVAVFIYLAFRFIYDTRRVFPERCFWAGLLTGYAFLCEFAAIVPLVVFGLGLITTESRERSTRLFFYSAGVAPMILVMGIYYYFVFGSPVAMFSQYAITFPSFSNLYELLISPSGGLFFFSPILLFAVFSVFDSNERGFRRQRLKLVTIFLTVLTILLITPKYDGILVASGNLILVIPLMLDTFFDGEIEDYPSLWRGFLFSVSFLFCTIPMLTYFFAPDTLQFPHNSFWQPLLSDANIYTHTLANAFGLVNNFWTIVPAMAGLLLAVYFVWRDAKFPFRFAVGLFAGFLLVGNYMFLADLERDAAKPFLENTRKQTQPS